MPIKELYVLCGLPFSGKTTFARSIPHAEIISRDAIMEQILASVELMRNAKNRAGEIINPVSRLYQTKEQNALNDAITELYTTEVQTRLQKSTSGVVIVDGLHLQPLSRAFIHSLPSTQKIAVIFTTPLEICIERFNQSFNNKNLGTPQYSLPTPTLNTLTPSIQLRSTLSPAVISRLAAMFELPTLSEGFDRIETRG